VIDFGDLCAGDPACDLAAAWTLLPGGKPRWGPPARATLRRLTTAARP